MRLFLIAILLLLGCRSPVETKDPLDRLVQRKISFIKRALDMGAGLYPHRCDRLTFNGLFSGYGKPQDMGGFYYDGLLHRDVSPCYPGFSRSEISLDGILGLLHHIQTWDDRKSLDRILDIGEKNNWIMGDGPIEYTNIWALVPIIYEMAGESLVTDIKDVLKGYRGHVGAMYIHLRGRVYGSISEAEFRALQALKVASPLNPLYSALFHRYSDGDQSETIELLDKIFTDKFPEGSATTGWGSCPDSVLYIIVVGILQGI